MRSLCISTSLLAAGLVLAGCSHHDKTSSTAPPPASAAAAVESPPAASSAPPAVSAPRGRPDKPLNVLLLTVDACAPTCRGTATNVRLPRTSPGSLSTRPSIPTPTRFRATRRRAWPRSSLAATRPASIDRLSSSPATARRPLLPGDRTGARDQTIAGHAHLYFGRGKDLDQGFDTWELVPGITFDPQTDNYITSDKLTELAIGSCRSQRTSGKLLRVVSLSGSPRQVQLA